MSILWKELPSRNNLGTEPEAKSVNFLIVIASAIAFFLVLHWVLCRTFIVCISELVIALNYDRGLDCIGSL
ncbi:hypothetical protein NBG4_180010 [Candidatus Sulfobium mesophilum]|uniref:Uncharacterized protein n=1 Tax=Candidatus Sulfobium mesophilum TaxID=2016548 RepID=A0A2U3QFG7_9BACT|nr:hypothetical protein NBG4_180010 [Candidatus Sulfobium mesophilum]